MYYPNRDYIGGSECLRLNPKASSLRLRPMSWGLLRASWDFKLMTRCLHNLSPLILNVHVTCRQVESLESGLYGLHGGLRSCG